MPDPDVTPAVPHNFCGSCGTRVQPGARFCSGCGAAIGGDAAGRPAATGTAPEPRTPWLVAAALSVVAIAAVVYAAGNRTNAGPLDMSGGGTGVTQTGQDLGRAPPIGDMPPLERFTRLNDRVMGAAESGDTTTVINFWPMAHDSYHMLPASDRDVDTRYHMATLYLLVGQFPQVNALADTIMTESPDNLMGWYLRAIVADFQQDSTNLHEARRNFAAQFDAEMAKGRKEYVDHASMLRDYLTVTGPRP